MHRSFRPVVGSALLLTLIAAGFSGGKAIGSRLRPHPEASLTPWIPGSSLDVDSRSAPPAPPSEVFASVLEKVQQDFVGSTGTPPISNARLTEGALGRMTASLQDPRTVYLGPPRAESRVNSLLGKYSGIGAELTIVTTQSKPDDINYSFLTVKSVAPGSPAESMGLHTGDRITGINGQWVIAYTILSDSGQRSRELASSKYDDSKHDAASQISPGISAGRAIQVLTTGKGVNLRLTIDGNGRRAPKEVSITTAQTVVPAVQHRLLSASGVTYLRVNEFNSNASSAIESILSRRQDWAVGLIIDLRQNPGGVDAEERSGLNGYRSALDLIGQVAQHPIVGQIERKPEVRADISATGTRPASNRRARIAVLIDGGTSNIAEMTAAGMRDAGGAKLIGSRTFGDDVLPFLSVLKAGGAIELTSAHLFTVSGGDLSAGVNPDIPADTAPQAAGQTDPAMSRAIRFISGQ